MNIPAQLMIALGSVLILLLLMRALRGFAMRLGIASEMQRKLVHIATGLYALSWPWLFPDRWPAYVLIGLTIGVLTLLRLPKIANHGIGATLHGVERRSYGDILLAVAVGLCLMLSGSHVELYLLPVAVLTFSDAAAALVGSTYGKRVFQVENGTKTVEGCLTFFIITFLLALIILRMMTLLPTANIIAISILVAAFGTLIEAASWRGFDNLFLPVGLLIMLDAGAYMDLPQLLSRVVLFGVTLLVFRVISKPLGLGLHASRVYVTMIFLLLAATDYLNALTPILALLCHIWCRTRNPGDDPFPDLDAVAALTLVSVGWLAVGTGLGWNATSVYSLSAMGMCAGFATLATIPDHPHDRLIRLGACISLLCAIRLWITLEQVNPTDEIGLIWIGVVATLLLTILPPMRWPDAFHRDRAAKITALALITPVTAYLWATHCLGLLG